MAEQGMDISEVTASSSPITLHDVVVGQVSPLKSSKTKSGVRYFDGSFTDGKKTLQMISFDPKMHDEFEEAKRTSLRQFRFVFSAYPFPFF